MAFESDDWGSIRMPNRETQQLLIKEGYKLDRCVYNTFDTLEREIDIEKLGNTLQQVKDKGGRHPIFTLNYLTRNPDFEKIKASEYQKYFSRSVLLTYQQHQGSEEVFALVQKGIQEGVFFPQFHGREHLDITRWLGLLQERHRDFLRLFELQMWGFGPKLMPGIDFNIQAALSSTGELALANQKNMLQEGMADFESLFGYKSKSFIPTNFVISEQHKEILAQEGVKGLQGERFELRTGGGKQFRFTGQRNVHRQLNWVRNVSFELLENQGIDMVNKSMQEIEMAFRWGKPAVITSHRINFVGGLNQKSADQGIESLGKLLKMIVAKWPDVEFVHAHDLIDLLNANGR